MNHINPQNQPASWPIKWGQLLFSWSPTSLQPLSHLIPRIYDIIVLSLSRLKKHDFSPPFYLTLFEPVVQTWQFAISEMEWLCPIPTYWILSSFNFFFLLSCNNRATYQGKCFPTIWTFNLHKEVFISYLK